ncbi:MAG TPA: DNRLRE domain-containing protein [Fibrobacteria bacterium]|nr:DNRLRE domain-containing protein [Fibrobacteria bacterium]
MSIFKTQSKVYRPKSTALMFLALAGISFGQSKWEVQDQIYRVNSITSVTYGNNQFLAVGKAEIPDGCYRCYGTREFTSILASADGKSWTTRSLGITGNLNSVAFVNNQFVAVGDSGRIFISTDGASWAAQNSGTPDRLTSVAYGNGQYVVVSYKAGILSSTDGAVWTKTYSDNTTYFQSVTYGNNQFVAVGYYGLIFTSSDGVNWTKQNSGLIETDNRYHYLTSVTYGKGKFVAVGGESDHGPGVTGPTPLVLTSTDGVTWKSDIIGKDSFLSSVVHGNGRFVAVGSEGAIHTSPDGTTWTKQNLGTTKHLPSAAYGNGMFMAVQEPNVILTSKSDNENCKATDMGNGTIVFEVKLPMSQQYVEVFVRQNGIQNVAQNIVDKVDYNHDGTVTYKYVGSGYKAGDVVEYRFYSYAPNSQGVFTPGPIENSWNKLTVSLSSYIAPVTKDASLILSSYCCGFVPDRNFGSSSTVDAGTYHHTAKGAFGFSLGVVPSGKVVTEALLVLPGISSAGGSVGSVDINKVNNSASWQESTVTWNNAPSYTYFNTFKLPAQGAASIDITELVSAAVSMGESEISIMMTPVTNNYFVDSKENASGKSAYIYIKTR